MFTRTGNHLAAPVLLAGFLLAGLGCGGDGSGANELPTGATTLKSYLEAGIKLGIARLDGLESTLPLLVNPGAPGAGAVTFQLDQSPGAPPNSYTFNIPLDGDGDGAVETTVSGSAAFTGDPSTPDIGFGGHVDFSVDMMGGLGSFDGQLDFALTNEGREVSGNGTFTEAVTGTTTTLTVDPAAPLVFVPPTGRPDTVANACAYSADGALGLEVSGQTGVLSAIWNFFSNQRNVSVTNASYTDPDNVTTPVPNSSVTIPCGNARLADWAGVYRQNWICFPPDFGQAVLTLTPSGNTTINISDEDPPGSGNGSTYSAQVVSGNPNVVRGFFIAGPPGFTYREDFTWTLASDFNSFTQTTHYAYETQPGGGFCGGTATRMP